MSIALLSAFYFLFPAIIIYAALKFPILNKIGTIVIAYIIGIVAGNIGLIPKEMYDFQDTLTGVSVLIALPLLLFSADVKNWFKSAGKTAMLSGAIALFSIVTMVIIGYFAFGGSIENANKIAGLLIGVYTGGTPNMAALKSALNVDPEMYILVHTYDLVLGSVYLMLLLVVGRKVFHLFLKPFKKSETKEQESTETSAEDIQQYSDILKKPHFGSMLFSVLLSIVILAIAFGTGQFVNGDMQAVVIILLVTSGGLGLSFVPKVNRITKSFPAGMYFILVFSLVVSSMADISKLAVTDYNLFFYVALTFYGTVALHILLSKLFGVDADTAIITSVALAYSPPFVPLVASAIKNKQVILSGITIGIIGYAIGNYIGVLVAYVLGG